MQIAIMQPYAFPYIGYFQLVKAVDLFIFYNDVNFIKRGWVHRNRILLNQKDFMFTIPCAEVSQNKRICDTRTAFDSLTKKKLLASINHGYKRAPHFERVYSLIEDVLNKDAEFIDELAITSVKDICNYLSIPVRFEESKDRYGNENMVKAERLIDICRQEGSNSYVNAIGGREIYTREIFKEKGIDIKFLRPNPVVYKQFGDVFVPWLSIIDVLMFNNKEEIDVLLNNYELI